MAQAKKRKRFFDVEIPLIKKGAQLQAYDIQDLNGRFIKYDLTRILKGKGAILSLIVNVNKDNTAEAKPKEMKLVSYFIKRMVRKGTDYVEDSFLTESKDSQVKIKPFIVTRRRVPRSVRKALREKLREELIIYVKDKTSEQLFKDILDNKLQKDLSLKLKKIYPLSLCEIRVLKIEKNQK